MVADFSIITTRLAYLSNIHENAILILVTVLFSGWLFIRLICPTRGWEFDKPRLSDLTNLTETYTLDTLGEREFARRLLDFEQQVDGDYEKALKILAITHNPEIRQIGYCWLTHQGYGNLPMTTIWFELERLKELVPQD